MIFTQSYLLSCHYRVCEGQSGDRKVPVIKTGTMSVRAPSWRCVCARKSGGNPGIKRDKGYSTSLTHI